MPAREVRELRCPHCGKEFTTRDKRQHFCSRECSCAAMRAKLAAMRDAGEQRGHGGQAADARRASLARRREQGEVMGVAQSVGSLSRVLGPLIAGSLFAEFGRNSPFLWGAMLVGLALIVGRRLPRVLGVAAAPGAPPPGAAE